jgi:hypothetical protein
MIPKPIKPKENKLDEQVERVYPYNCWRQIFQVISKRQEGFYIQL